MIDVIYYHYFLFYKKLSTEIDTHFSAALALGASESLLISAIVDTVSLKYYCYKIDVPVMFCMFVGVCILNCLYYMRGRGEEIVERKPLFFGSKSLSAIGTLLFFLVSFSWLIWGSIYGKYLLEQCRGN